MKLINYSLFFVIIIAMIFFIWKYHSYKTEKYSYVYVDPMGLDNLRSIEDNTVINSVGMDSGFASF
jgi:hypothetical protein